jgi:hypothetical protein
MYHKSTELTFKWFIISKNCKYIQKVIKSKTIREADEQFGLRREICRSHATDPVNLTLLILIPTPIHRPDSMEREG